MNDIILDRVNRVHGRLGACVLVGGLVTDALGPSASQATGSAMPAIQVIIGEEIIMGAHMEKLHGMKSLAPGWNGYSAPPPSETAISTARSFLSSLEREHFEPTRVAPSAVGGVGITHEKKKRRAYVEFFNGGEVCVLFSDNESRPVSKRVKAGYADFRALIGDI